VLHLYTSQETYGEFSHRPDMKFTSFKDIHDEIERETSRVAGSNKGISPHPIALKIFSPKVLNLTLVDTPGITKVPVGDQPGDIESQIRKLVFTYITRPSALIVALTAANTDLANSDALQLAKEVDPRGDRTLGVISKLDLMDKGTHAGEILQNRTVPLRLGYVAIINRSQKDIQDKKTISKHLEQEQVFFESHPVYCEMPNCGTASLAKKLNRVLVDHIAATLPDLRTRISTQLKEVQEETKEFTEWDVMEDRAAAKSALLLNMLAKYTEDVRAAVDIGGTTLNMLTMTGGARISFIFDDIFVPAMAKLNPLEGLSEEDIRITMRNSKGAKTWLFIPEDTFEVLAKRQVKQLEAPAIQCVELVVAELQTLCGECEMGDIKRYVNMPVEINNVVRGLLQGFAQPTLQCVRHLIAIEAEHINLAHPDFVQVTKSVAASDDNSEAGKQQAANDQREQRSKEQGFFKTFFNKKGGQGEATPGQLKVDDKLTIGHQDITVREQRGLDMLKGMIEVYFSIIRRKICDQVPKAIMAMLVNRLKEQLYGVLVAKLYNADRLDALLSETEEVVTRRRHLLEIEAMLSRAMAALDEVQGIGTKVVM